MKFKNVKIFFIIFVMLIVFIAVLNMNSKSEKKPNIEEQAVNEVIYQDNIKLGVCDFDSINPLITKNKQIIDIERLVYEPLLSLNTDYKLNLCLATEYAKTSPTTYIVKVNNSINWSDGSRIIADDIKYTVDLLKKENNIYSENVKNIQSVDVVDDSTVKFNLSSESDFFEYNLIFPIMCKSYYGEEDFFTSDKVPIGTGKYKIVSKSDNQIILEKNGNYRDQDKTNKSIEKIYVNIYPEMNEVYNSFKIGNIDIMSTSNVSFEDYIGTMGYNIKEYKGREYDFLSCNCNDYLLKEKSVRQAISFAIDKENIVSTVYNNKYRISEYPLDFGSYLYSSDDASLGYNQEKAKEILMNDGWTYKNNRWRKNGRTLLLTISVSASNEKRREVAKIIKNQLQAIGIQVNIAEISDYQYNAYLKNKNYQILLTGVYSGYSPDLTYFYGDNNIANYSNDEVKNLINDVKNITDEKSLEERYGKLINITKDDCAYISLYRNKGFMLFNQNVSGNFQPTNYSMFTNFESWNKE